MAVDLLASLPLLLPKAIAWAEECAEHVARTGARLVDSQIDIARSVGVQYPERVRLALVPAIPHPSDSELLRASSAIGLLSPDMVGLTLGHSILICHGHLSAAIFSHECRHVHQYETAGSIADFLPVYVRQILEYGYLDAPLEIDARNHERPG